MRQLILLLSLCICSGVFAQTLATREGAEKAKKVVIVCDGYTAYEAGNAQPCLSSADEVNIVINRFKKDRFEIECPPNNKFQGENKSYRKVNDSDKIQLKLLLFDGTQDSTSPKIAYMSEPGNIGNIVSKMYVTDSSDKTYVFNITKCLFFNEDGASQNYYTKKTYTVKDDLLYYFLDSMKFKKEKNVEITDFPFN